MVWYRIDLICFRRRGSRKRIKLDHRLIVFAGPGLSRDDVLWALTGWQRAVRSSAKMWVVAQSQMLDGHHGIQRSERHHLERR